MAGDTVLTAATRGELLSAQKTGTLIERTSDRLATGLRVSSAKDNAVAFFQARALNERAGDFVAIKDKISSGVSAIKAAMDGLSGLEKLLSQMKGIALGAKTEPSPAKRYEMSRQYSTIRTQLDTIAADASYNGENLIGNPANDLRIKLSPADSNPQTSITIPGVIMTASTLGLDDTVTVVDSAGYNGTPAKKAALDDWVASIAGQTNSGSGPMARTSATMSGINLTDALDPFGNLIGTAGYLALYVDQAAGTVSLDSGNLYSDGIHSASAIQYQAALVLQDFMANGGTLGATVTDVPSGLAATAFTIANYPGVAVVLPDYPWESTTNYLDNIDHAIGLVDAAVGTVRSTMAQMGSNTALLQIRLDFTSKTVNGMKQGASQLVNADLNEEGANLVALQTRQQLVMSSLRFTGDSEKGILSLFR